MNHELWMFKLDLEKAEEPEIKLPTSAGSLKKQESSTKTSTSALLTMPKPLTCVDHNKLWKILKRWEYETTWSASWEIYMQVKKQQLELDVEQQTGSKSGKENVKAVYCHPAYLTSMQSTSWEMPGWMKHKLQSRLLGEISVMSSQICRWYHPRAESEEELKSLLMKVKVESEKNWLKAQHSENEDHGIWSHHFMGNRWGNSGISVRLYFVGLQNHCRWWLQPWN